MRQLPLRPGAVCLQATGVGLQNRERKQVMFEIFAALPVTAKNLPAASDLAQITDPVFVWWP